jgi:hypothetical protein
VHYGSAAAGASAWSQGYSEMDGANLLGYFH